MKPPPSVFEQGLGHVRPSPLGITRRDHHQRSQPLVCAGVVPAIYAVLRQTFNAGFNLRLSNLGLSLANLSEDFGADISRQQTDDDHDNQ
jgi:hypothetical protein